MMVSSEPSGGHIDDETDQHAGNRPGKGQLSSLRNWSGWGVCGLPLFGKRNLRFVGGVFDRTCVRPLSVAFMTPRAGMLFGRPGSYRFRELQALEPRV